jgi:N-carbamoyl-L-amino-acid hydrolase
MAASQPPLIEEKAMSSPTSALQPQRTIDELKELRTLTGNTDGAQRVAWTDTWAAARAWMRAKLGQLPVEIVVDEAGNQWATLRGASERELLIGGHIDSVPNGGWLDGCLNVLAGLEVLRRIASQGTPPVTVRLVDWADEEGARFGRSLFGSSSVAGTMDPEELEVLKDRDGIRLPDALARFDVDLLKARDAAKQLKNAAAYLELHIEQGPVLESMDLPMGVVLGTFGVERHRIVFSGQAAHSGSTPMPVRRDSFLAAARAALLIQQVGLAHEGGYCTTGGASSDPGVVTAVAGRTELLLDQRHLDAGELAAMLAEAKASADEAAATEKCTVAWERIWQIEPIPFDPALIAAARASCRAVSGTDHALPSGPLHDAAEMARLVPTVMLFSSSTNGISHAKEEDTPIEHLELAIRAYAQTVGHAVDLVAAG